MTQEVALGSLQSLFSPTSPVWPLTVKPPSQNEQSATHDGDVEDGLQKYSSTKLQSSWVIGDAVVVSAGAGVVVADVVLFGVRLVVVVAETAALVVVCFICVLVSNGTTVVVVVVAAVVVAWSSAVVVCPPTLVVVGVFSRVVVSTIGCRTVVVSRATLVVVVPE